MYKGYFDLQVNGYAGVDFNQNDLSPEDLHNACAKLKEDGVQGILATIITASPNDMINRLQNLTHLREQDKLVKKIIFGIHIEGPFISKEPGYRGAHPVKSIKSADTELLKLLLDAADGLTKIVTLAPEIDDNFRMIKMLAKKDITVSAGHCNPDMDELQGAIDSGLSMFTHLGNGCPANLDRHDNIIQRVLSFKDQFWLCFIADGIHIPFFVLKNYIDLAGYEKTIIVTDAMAAASAPPGNYYLSNLQLEVGNDYVVRESGKLNFSGSATTMQQSQNNLMKYLGLNDEQCRQLTNENPMKVIGMDRIVEE